MVKIRLKRLGYKRNPIYRVVVINSASKREGRPIQELGYYNPKHKELKLNKEAALEWIKKGAQPTDTVKYLLDNSDENGILIKKTVEEKKISKKAKAKLEAEQAAKAEAAASAKAEAEAKKAAEAEAKVAAETAAKAPVVEEAVEVVEETAPVVEEAVEVVEETAPVVEEAIEATEETEA